MTDPANTIAIIGTGPTGLLAALAVADATAHKIILLGPCPTEQQRAKDTRTTAFMAPSLNMLENMDLWPELAASAAPLTHLRMIDDLGGLFRAPDCLFSANELDMKVFAQNIPNKDLLDCLITRIKASPDITWLETKAVTDIVSNDDSGEQTHTITTSEKNTCKAAFIIGADGRNSLCRKKSGITATPWRYDQTAIACSFSHEAPHNATSLELHRNSGPLTLIPLKEHHASLVWSLKPGEADRIGTLSDQEFASELTAATHAVWGKISSPGKRVAFPVSGLKVNKFAAKRIALIGEAAHVVPPIGAQGLNLGLRDIAYLTDCLINHPDLKGNVARLESDYNENRSKDVWSRTTAIDWLNKSLVLSFLPLSAARIAGLNLLNISQTMRRSLMNAGLNGPDSLPPLMQAS